MLNACNHKIKSYLYAISLCLLTAFSAVPVNALTAEDVMKKMTQDQRSSFLLGVIEGLAFSRYVKDKPNTKGMECIHDWKYGSKGDTNTLRMLDLFDKRPKQPVVPLLYVLIKQDCGA